MNNTVAELLNIVELFERKINSIDEAEFAAKPNPNKWSKKEVLGHLIDSAQNNLRRFIVGQYEHQPKIRYKQEFWVEANGYQAMKKSDVIQLWVLVNQRIAAVLSNTSSENGKRQVDTGNDQPELHTIEWLASDYVKHLKHHLNQIIAGSFDVLYP